MTAQEYDLFDLAIFAEDADGVFIYDSTIPEEIGERTREWGYWNEAFKSLFAREKPLVQGGQDYDYYWIGP